MKFTNYILPLETAAPKTHYMSAYSVVDLSPHNESISKIIVSQINQFLRVRFHQMKLGDFDTIDLDWQPPNLAVLHVNDISRSGIQSYKWGKPADDYLPLMKNAIPKFNSTFLNKQMDYWPQSFKHINEKVKSDDYHISFMPVVRFPQDNLQIVTLINQFSKLLNGISSFRVKTTGKLKMFAKWDMKKVFLGMEVEQNDNLDEIVRVLQDFRLNLSDKGVVMGENDGCILNWVNSTPHITIGVWSSSFGDNSIDLNNTIFGFWELLYLNEILMKSPETLEREYPDYIASELDMKLPEVPIMSFEISNVTLVANSQKLRKRFT